MRDHRLPVDDRSEIGSRETGHISAELMAMYVDRTASSAERELVHRHISTCDRCRDVLADLVSIVEEEHALDHRSFLSRHPRYLTAAAVLAAAAVLVLVIRVWRPSWLSGAGAGAAGVSELLEAYATEPYRPSEGRLSAPFSYAPAPPVTRGDTPREVSADVRLAVSDIESAAQHDPSAKAKWAMGVARLALGQVDGAIAALQDASRDDPSNAAVRSDLAAAYLARARTAGHSDDLTAALEEADEALQLSPGLLPALFNRALALDALGRADAPNAWRAYIDTEHDSKWIAEATRRAAAR